MIRRTRAIFIVAAAMLPAREAFAHHVMDNRLPADFLQGILSGLGHPIIGLDHFAAVIAVGCLAAAHRTGSSLIIGFVLAMIAGAAVHVHGATVPFAEPMVALSVVLLGFAMLRRQQMTVEAAMTLFVLVGSLHGYALGESITGAERTPLLAYFAGLAITQIAVALTAMTAARYLLRRETAAMPLRLTGAAIAGIGLAIFFAQLTGAA